jgi:hypothetical protein
MTTWTLCRKSCQYSISTALFTESLDVRHHRPRRRRNDQVWSLRRCRVQTRWKEQLPLLINSYLQYKCCGAADHEAFSTVETFPLRLIDLYGSGLYGYCSTTGTDSMCIEFSEEHFFAASWVLLPEHGLIAARVPQFCINSGFVCSFIEHA